MDGEVRMDVRKSLHPTLSSARFDQAEKVPMDDKTVTVYAY